RIPGQLRRLRPPRPELRLRLRGQRPVPVPAPVPITGHLPAHRRRCPAQPRRDLPARLTRRHPQRDLLPLSHRQAPAAHHPPPRPPPPPPPSRPPPPPPPSPPPPPRPAPPPPSPPRPPPQTPACTDLGTPGRPFFTTTTLHNRVLRRLAETARV